MYILQSVLRPYPHHMGGTVTFHLRLPYQSTLFEFSNLLIPLPSSKPRTLPPNDPMTTDSCQNLRGYVYTMLRLYSFKATTLSMLSIPLTSDNNGSFQSEG